MVGLTGAQLVEEAVQPKRGDLLLVTGAVGSVGRVAVYAARRIGARVIAGVRAKQKGAASDAIETSRADFALIGEEANGRYYLQQQ